MSYPSAFTPKLLSVLARGYSRAGLKADALAGLTVAIVALPLAMALAIACGASPDKGLVTAVVGGFLISCLGGSRLQVGGPTGAFVVLMASVITAYGYDGLVLATLMAGVILLVAGGLRLGTLMAFIPHSVVVGFTAGIAVLIISTQIKDFLGLPVAALPVEFMAKLAALAVALPRANPATTTLGLFVLLGVLGLRRYAPKLPAFLLVVVAATLAVTVLKLPVETIGSRFPILPSGLPMPHMPHWTLESLMALAPSAFAIAFLAGLEALLSAVVADGMTDGEHRPNQELLAQGVANIAAALFAGLPATGAVARTATNIKAGARTPLAGMFHAVFLLLFMLFGMNLVALIPLTALAVILFMVAWGMSDAGHCLRILRSPSPDRWPLLVTFAVTVLVDLTMGIVAGLVVAALLSRVRRWRAEAQRLDQDR